MTETTSPLELDLKPGLSAWALKNEIRPVDFAEQMGYTQAHGWSLLRGQAPVTVEVLGRVVIAFGGTAADEIVKVARKAEKATA